MPEKKKFDWSEAIGLLIWIPPLAAWFWADHKYGLDLKQRPWEAIKAFSWILFQLVAWIFATGALVVYSIEVFKWIKRKVDGMKLSNSIWFRGFFRVTLVVSIIFGLIGILILFVDNEDFLSCLILGLIFAAFPWVIFWTGVFIALGFRPNRAESDE